MNTHDKFEQVSDDFLKFDLVENKLSTRPDLHAFILLNKLFPDNRDIIAAAGHDVIYLDITMEQTSELTDDQILDLTRCGVMFDDEDESLRMFA